MKLKVKIAALQYFEFLAWGSWLITIGAYCFETKEWTASQFGTIMSTVGLAAIIMPAIGGIIADRWLNAERLFGLLHVGCLACMIFIPEVRTPNVLFWVMLLNMCFYMPTIPLVFSISYNVMEQANMDIIKEYPPLRIFGTLGFASGMWATSLLGLETSALQFYISAGASAAACIVAFMMPACPPLGKAGGSLISRLGLDALKLFKNYNMAVFFMFSILLGVCMQLSNAYVNPYLHDFSSIEKYAASPMLKFPAIIVSLGQFSEMFFVLLVPFFLKKYGIKKIMVMSCFAWVLRWLLLAYGNPGELWFLIIFSMFIWGMAFDFFNLSGSLYIEKKVDPAIRSSAQGLYQVMVIGIGAALGSYISGWMIDTFFTSVDGVKDWRGVMLAFAAYSLIIGILFVILFRDKHEPGEI